MSVPARIEPFELVPATDDGELWERLRGESRPAFANFAHYRDLGRERSIRKAAESLGKHLTTLSDQSIKYHWQDRVTAYDDYLDRRLRDELESERSRVNREGSALFRSAQLLAARRLRGAAARDGQPEIKALDANELTAADVARLMDVSWRGLRTATGQPTDVIKGFFNITSDDLVRVAQGIYEIGERLMPEERKGRYASEVQAFIERGGQ